MTDKIIINGDDFALNKSCTEAIAEAFDKNLISSATACANGEFLGLAFSMAKEKGFNENVGIHINFTEGRPLTKNILNDEFFCAEGVFHGKIDRLKKPSDKSVENLKEELSAQIEKLKGAGFTLSHADSHHHIHTAVFLEEPIKEILFKYGITKIRLHRNAGKIPLYKKIVKNIYNSALKKQGFATTEKFGGVSDFTENALSDKFFSEIMVHPDFDSSGALIDRKDYVSGVAVGESLFAVKDIIKDKTLVSYRQVSSR